VRHTRLLRCSPAGFDVGGRRDGWYDGFTLYLIDIKAFGGGCGDSQQQSWRERAREQLLKASMAAAR
jgi:hypothetical protein